MDRDVIREQQFMLVTVGKPNAGLAQEAHATPDRRRAQRKRPAGATKFAVATLERLAVERTAPPANGGASTGQ